MAPTFANWLELFTHFATLSLLGVGGAIVAIVPQFGVITAWSPPLNRFGNSVVAMELIHRLADELGLSLF